MSVPVLYYCFPRKHNLVSASFHCQFVCLIILDLDKDCKTHCKHTIECQITINIRYKCFLPDFHCLQSVLKIHNGLLNFIYKNKHLKFIFIKPLPTFDINSFAFFDN